MSDPFVGLVGFGVVFVLILLGVHIGIALATVGFFGFVYLVNLDAGLSLLPITTFTVSSNFSFTVVPLFILMGQFAATSGISADAYHVAHKWLRGLPGGLALATIGGCAFFSATCGSSLATAATIGTIAYPEMKKYNYDSSLSTGSIAAGGTLGFLIPPSFAFVIYAILTETSLGKLLIAGIFPGIILATMFMLTIGAQVMLNRRLAPSDISPISYKEKLRSLKDVWGTALLFFLVIGGIYAGVFTPTEAAALGAFGALLLILVRRRLKKQTLSAALLLTAKTSGMIFLILIGATIFSHFLAVTRLPMVMAQFISGLDVSRYGVLAAVIVLYIILGCVIDVVSMLVLTMPAVFPTISALGFDPIWFGVVIVLMMEAGSITPPIGMNVYIISGIADDVPITNIFRGVAPFFIAMLVTVVILIIFPQISLFLPRLMLK